MILPIDIWSEISKHISISDQANFYRINKAIYALPINNYCHMPSNHEIVNWLFKQSEEMKYSIFKRGIERKKNLSLYFGTSITKGKKIYLNLKSGEIYRSTENKVKQLIATKKEALEYLQNTSLYLSIRKRANWLVTREILSFRSSYIVQNISSDACYVQLMAKYLALPATMSLYNWLEYLQQIAKLLNKTTRLTFEHAFSRFINKPIISSISDITADPYKNGYDTFRQRIDCSTWLSNWILQLDSKDLIENLDLVTCDLYFIMAYC